MYVILLQILAALAPEQPVAPGSWSKVAVHQSGAVATVCTVPGPDIGLRINGGPLQIVNTYTQGVQDEPAVAATPGGFVVAWDQRDPSYMHVALRRYDVAGVPLGPVEQIDNQPTAWRCLLAARGDGLVACLYTGGYDNNAHLRLYDAQSATFIGGSSVVATNPNGDQEDVAGCWLPSGDLFLVWVDFHGGGLGLELMSRVYSAAGNFLSNPARLVLAGLGGDQRFPVCALGPNGSPWIAWQDNAGVWLLKGLGGAPVWLGSGVLPELAPPWIVYQSAGDVWARNGDTLAPAVRLNRWQPGVQQRPSVALAANGDVLCGWSGPSFFGTTSTAFVRRFTVQ